MAVVHVLFVASLLPFLAVIHFIWRRGRKTATLFGKLDAFEENTETWEKWVVLKDGMPETRNAGTPEYRKSRPGNPKTQND